MKNCDKVSSSHEIGKKTTLISRYFTQICVASRLGRVARPVQIFGPSKQDLIGSHWLKIAERSCSLDCPKKQNSERVRKNSNRMTNSSSAHSSLSTSFGATMVLSSVPSSRVNRRLTMITTIYSSGEKKTKSNNLFLVAVVVVFFFCELKYHWFSRWRWRSSAEAR